MNNGCHLRMRRLVRQDRRDAQDHETQINGCELRHQPVKKSISLVRKQHGLTLIEVIAGLALLSMLLVGALLSFGRLQKQTVLSARRIQACKVADQLLNQWMSEDAILPIGQTGPADTALIWATHIVETQTVRSLRLHTVRLEISDSTILSEDQPPLASVDVLVAIEANGQQRMRQGIGS